jgi:hypothetical protein
MYRRRLLGLAEDRGNRRLDVVSHDREGLGTAGGTKPFAIMKDGRGCEVSGVPGAGVTIDEAVGEGFSWWPVLGERPEPDRRLNG